LFSGSCLDSVAGNNFLGSTCDCGTSPTKEKPLARSSANARPSYHSDSMICLISPSIFCFQGFSFCNLARTPSGPPPPPEKLFIFFLNHLSHSPNFERLLLITLNGDMQAVHSQAHRTSFGKPEKVEKDDLLQTRKS
jgi:hypothetical protein